MSGPNVWDINENIIANILVTDPSTGLGLTGQASYITLKIRRTSDDKYWNGSNWKSSVQTLSVTETDAANEPGLYTYTLTGNNSANKYFFHITISNPPTIEANDSEIHVSRDLTVRVYESEPIS